MTRRSGIDYVNAAKDGPIRALLDRTNAMQTQIVTPLARRSPTPTPNMATFLVSLNDMFDSASSRRFAFVGRVPLNLLYALVGGPPPR